VGSVRVRGAARDRQNVGKARLLPDLLPDDPRHLVSIELNDGLGDFDLGHVDLCDRESCTQTQPVPQDHTKRHDSKFRQLFANRPEITPRRAWRERTSSEGGNMTGR
jgi:hypothetical protein